MAPMIQVNLNEAERIEPLPEGDYLLKVVDTEYPTPTKSGGEMLSLTLEVVEPTKISGVDKNGKKIEIDIFGRKVWHRFSTRVMKDGVYNDDSTKKAWGFLADFVDILGVKANAKGELESNDFMNATAWCHVKQREYEGRISNECGKFFQAGVAVGYAPSR